jgi:hypothetical protein
LARNINDGENVKQTAKKRASKDPSQIKSGQLKIGDSWNAITIIAFSQNNPLKAIAEFVENSIDAGAKKIVITRGRSRGENFIKIVDNGSGIPKGPDGLPNFKYVATHICDSIKRQLKKDGAVGIQGEFGIGLLSFWTVGSILILRSSGTDGHIYQMKMERGCPGYHITKSRSLAPVQGTELIIHGLLPGLRQLSGEKVQRYLASELRDRIRQNAVEIRVLDHVTRSDYLVEPRKFSGQLIHHKSFPCDPFGEIDTEIYLSSPQPENHIALYRSGTRVMADLSRLEAFDKEPWTSGYFQGLLDVPFLNLTPGTRDGLIHDERLNALAETLQSLEAHLNSVIAQQKQHQDEESNRHILKTVQKAIREALLILPEEEYDWFEVYSRGKGPRQAAPAEVMPYAVENFDSHQRLTSFGEDLPAQDSQKQFFEYAGPLHRIQIAPASCTVMVKQEKILRAVCRDKQGRRVDDGLTCHWEILEGEGQLLTIDEEIVRFIAPDDPQICRIGLTVRQYEEQDCRAEGILTVTDSVLPETRSQGALKKGLPGYTLKKSPGELWRSRFDSQANIVLINSGHRDFMYASGQKSRKVRYIFRLYIKELVLANFMELGKEDLLERMIEVSLYAEEGLK